MKTSDDPTVVEKRDTVVVDGHAAYATPTTYTITCLPGDLRGGHDWDLTVEFTGAHRYGVPRPPEQQWAVRMRGHWCLSNDGYWDEEAIPSERADEWLTEHRFDLDTAIRLAKEAAPTVEINGLTPAGLLDQRRQAGIPVNGARS